MTDGIEEVYPLQTDLTCPMANSDLADKELEYDPLKGPNSERAFAEAANSSLLVVLPAADELLIDIDNDHSFLLYLKQLDIVNKYIGVESVIETESRSGLPHRHVTVKLKTPVSPIERIALQTCLGSDRVRELLGYVRAKNGDPNPTLFLENPKPIVAPII